VSEVQGKGSDSTMSKPNEDDWDEIIRETRAFAEAVYESDEWASIFEPMQKLMAFYGSSLKLDPYDRYDRAKVGAVTSLAMHLAAKQLDEDHMAKGGVH
jgi:hypothetical protein